MADETSETNLLTALTNLHLGADRNAELPARRDEREPAGDEPIDHGEPREIESRGRTPAEVLGDREERQPRQPVISDDDNGAPAPKSKAVSKIKYRGQELTADELLSNPATLEALVKTAEQFPALQKKHQQLLEDIAAKQLAERPASTPAAPAPSPEEAEEQHRQGTLKVIDAYKSMAEKEIAWYVEKGLIEADMPDAYHNALVSLFSILRYHLDLATANSAKTELAVEWINTEVGKRQALERVNQTKSALDTAIDAVAAKKEKIYAPLLKPEVRAEFVKWLREEVDPKVGAINEDTVGRLWVAFNAAAILEFDHAPQDTTQPTRRRRAAGDGTTSRPGGIDEPPKEKSMLDRMVELRLPAQE